MGYTQILQMLLIIMLMPPVMIATGTGTITQRDNDALAKVISVGSTFVSNGTSYILKNGKSWQELV